MDRRLFLLVRPSVSCPKTLSEATAVLVGAVADLGADPPAHAECRIVNKGPCCRTHIADGTYCTPDEDSSICQVLCISHSFSLYCALGPNSLSVSRSWGVFAEAVPPGSVSLTSVSVSLLVLLCRTA